MGTKAGLVILLVLVLIVIWMHRTGKLDALKTVVTGNAPADPAAAGAAGGSTTGTLTDPNAPLDPTQTPGVTVTPTPDPWSHDPGMVPAPPSLNHFNIPILGLPGGLGNRAPSTVSTPPFVPSRSLWDMLGLENPLYARKRNAAGAAYGFWN